MDDLIKWQEKFEEARNNYSKELNNFDDNNEAYNGTRAIKTPRGGNAKKQGSVSRKVCFEMVESQLDTVVSMPKVTSRKGREDRAVMIENVLRTEINRLPIHDILDVQARTCPTNGGAIFYLEWDNSVITPFGVGDLKLKDLSPKQVIPQPGVYDLDEMDYLFITFEQSKDYIKRVYGVDVELEGDESTEPLPDMRTHVFCYYRTPKNRIGLFSWVGDVVVQDYDDYFARKQEVCKTCGAVKNPFEDECEKCGGTNFETENKETEQMSIPVQTIDPMSGQPINMDETVDVKYYIPSKFPIVIRKNVSSKNKFLGSSDIDYIKDQQNDLNILMNKIREKVLKGGSYITVPAGKKIEATDEELKIIEIDNPADKAMFDIINVQPNVATDTALLEMDYTIARQTLGITDSFQGRQDKTATSGKAKEIAIAQTAGRLESKQTMKDDSFAKLYELMFIFLLAYTDEQRPYFEENSDGKMEYKWFDKKFFIDEDGNGEFYYDDQFVFEVDISGTLANDREAMWKETRSNFESGAYGDPSQMDTLEMYWTTMNKLHYPCAPDALKLIRKRKEEQRQLTMEKLQQKLLVNSYENSMVNNLVSQNAQNAINMNKGDNK